MNKTQYASDLSKYKYFPKKYKGKITPKVKNNKKLINMQRFLLYPFQSSRKRKRLYSMRDYQYIQNTFERLEMKIKIFFQKHLTRQKSYDILYINREP
jgi:hypothetical protein